MLIDDYLAELEQSEFVDAFEEHESGYICDIISEIADNAVSIYTADLIEFVNDNSDWVDEAIFNFGASGYGPIRDSSDLSSFVARIGSLAWFLRNESVIYENLEDCAIAAAVRYIQKKYNLDSLTDEQIENIEFVSFDSDDYLETYIDEVERTLFDDQYEDDPRDE